MTTETPFVPPPRAPGLGHRATGRTFAMLSLANQLAKHHKVVFIAATLAHSKLLRSQLGANVEIKSVASFDVRLSQGTVVGHDGPVIVDHFAYEVALDIEANKLKCAEREARDQKRHYENQILALQQQVRELESKLKTMGIGEAPFKNNDKDADGN